MAGPVSAFARRKTVQNGTNVVFAPVETTVVVTPDEAEASAPPRKRRRRGDLPKSVIAIPAPLAEHTAHQHDTDRDNQRDVEGSNSSDIEGELEIDLSVDEASPTNTARRLSSFSSRNSAILNDTDSEWRIRLNQRDSLAIVGQYDMWVRSGAISISGAVVHAGSKLHRVYAPSTHSIPSVKAIPNPYGTGNPPCEISIMSCGSRLRMLKQVAPKFGRIWNGRDQASSARRSFVNLHNSVDDPYKRPLRLLDPALDWSRTMSKLIASDRMAVMVCGPKGAGKSTFCRMLVNTLLSKMHSLQQNDRVTPSPDFVAFLDLDPGQPEYSPPGELSLHRIRSCNFGPPFSHPTSIGTNDLVRAHHVGHLSPKDDPRHYYRCAADLFSHYMKIQAEERLCPLIMNCSGWIQGSGLQLLDDFIADLALTDVIYMSTIGPEEIVETLREATIKADISLHQLTSHTSDMATRPASDLRMMQTLSYFHLDEPEGENLRWISSPLHSQSPLVVHYAGPKQDLSAVMVLGDEQSPKSLESILNGSIVGIVVVDRDLLFDRGETVTSHNLEGLEVNTGIDQDNTLGDTLLENWDYTHGMITDQHEIGTQPAQVLRTASDIPYLAPMHHTTQPLPPERSRSLGQAIVRDVDTNKNTLYLQTPIPSSIIQGILQQGQQEIVLVRGKLDTPTWAYVEQFEFEKARRRRLEGSPDSQGDFGSDNVRRWAEKHPWASVADGGRTSSGRVKRIRRDIRYKDQHDGPVK